MIERNDYVRVTSTKEEVVARFDGEDYQFLPGKPVDIHLIVAKHIFGFGTDDKSAALARLGWATSSDLYTKAMARLRNIDFKPCPNLVDAPEPEVTRASAGELMPNRTNGAPIGGAGEAGGVVATSPPANPLPAGKHAKA